MMKEILLATVLLGVILSTSTSVFAYGGHDGHGSYERTTINITIAPFLATDNVSRRFNTDIQDIEGEVALILSTADIEEFEISAGLQGILDIVREQNRDVKLSNRDIFEELFLYLQ